MHALRGRPRLPGYGIRRRTSLERPLLLPGFLRYAVQLSDALDAAHRQGIVAQDPKPANILVNKAGVKLLDFGLAKTAARPEDKTRDRCNGRRDGHRQAALDVAGAGPRKESRHPYRHFLVWRGAGGDADRHAAFDGDNTAAVISAIMTADPKALQGSDISPALEYSSRTLPRDKFATVRYPHRTVEEDENLIAVAMKNRAERLQPGGFPLRDRLR